MFVFFILVWNFIFLIKREQSLKIGEVDKNAEKLDFAEQTDKLLSKLDDIKKRIVFLKEVQDKLTELNKGKEEKLMEKSLKIV